MSSILFVLHTGIVWRHLPMELGFGSGITCWRRMEDWREAGIGEDVHRLLLARLRASWEIDWADAAENGVYSAKVAAEDPDRPRCVFPGARFSVLIR